MRVILCILMLSLVTACSSSEDTKSQPLPVVVDVSSVTLTENNSKAVVSFELAQPIDADKVITIKSNDNERILFGDSESINVALTPDDYQVKQTIELNLNLNTAIVCDGVKDLSISFFADGGEVLKKYIEIPVATNNPYAPLTLSLKKMKISLI